MCVCRGDRRVKLYQLLFLLMANLKELHLLETDFRSSDTSYNIIYEGWDLVVDTTSSVGFPGASDGLHTDSWMTHPRLSWGLSVSQGRGLDEGIIGKW